MQEEGTPPESRGPRRERFMEEEHLKDYRKGDLWKLEEEYFRQRKRQREGPDPGPGPGVYGEPRDGGRKGRPEVMCWHFSLFK